MRGFLHKAQHIKPNLSLSKSKSFSAKQIFLASLILFGIVLGALFEEASRAGGQAYMTYFTQQVLSVYQNGSFLGVMGFCFLSAFIMQSLVLFFGLSCIGTPAVALMPLCKGFSMGCVSGYLCSVYGLRGTLGNLIIFWLPDVIQCVLLLILANAALATSTNLFITQILDRQPVGGTRLLRCMELFLFTGIASLVPSLFSGALSVLFSPVFLRV